MSAARFINYCLNLIEVGVRNVVLVASLEALLRTLEPGFSFHMLPFGYSVSAFGEESMVYT